MYLTITRRTFFRFKKGIQIHRPLSPKHYALCLVHWNWWSEEPFSSEVQSRWSWISRFTFKIVIT